MKKENEKRPEQKVQTENDQKRTSDSGRDEIDPLKKEDMADRAKRENWTDVAESHLGIDE